MDSSANNSNEKQDIDASKSENKENTSSSIETKVSDNPEHKNGNTIGVMILQWLTYAFWGWAVLSLSALTASVVAHFIAGEDTGSFTPYGIAATLTLVPLALVCDIFYSKREPATKKGAEIAITTIHSVIFALFGVGSIIGAVISVVTIFTTSDDTKNSVVALVSLLIAAVYYGLTFLRTLDIKRIAWYKKSFKILMLVFALMVIIASIIGPIAKERDLRTDKLIENNIRNLNDEISRYVRTKDKLPEDLGVLELRKDTKKLVDQNLVVYKKDDALKGSKSISNSRSTTRSYEYYEYQLCVTYKYESNYNENNYIEDDLTYGSSSNDIGYGGIINTYNHPAGNVCYKQKAYID